ncbi:MAG: hypothetical protein Q9216_006072 [Gyalolechia sp. 2 TL-2023]
MVDTGMLSSSSSSPPSYSSSSPFPFIKNTSLFLPPRRPLLIFEDAQHTPPSSSSADDPTTTTNASEEEEEDAGAGTRDMMSPSSNKENDSETWVRMDREQRERQPTPSSSQDVIDPAGERVARSERLGEEWEIEREWVCG